MKNDNPASPPREPQPSSGIPWQDTYEITHVNGQRVKPSSEASAPQTEETSELDKLVADYKHIADNDGEHRIGDLIWLVNELIYEREHPRDPREPHAALLALITRWREAALEAMREGRPSDAVKAMAMEACADELSALITKGDQT